MADNVTPRRIKIRARDVFEAYFLKHHRNDILTVLEAENEDDYYSVTVNFLLMFEESVEVAESLLSSPVKLLPVMDTALQRAERKLIDELQNAHTDLSMKINIHARITGLPTYPELYRHAVPRTCDVGRFLCVSGTVVRTTAAKMLEYQKEFICSKCRHVFTVKADHDQYYQLSKPGRCPNPDDCYSYTFNPLGSSSQLLHTKDYQEIKIQEQVQKLVVGMIPRSLWVTLEDDLVDSCKPGDDVLICGIVRRRWRTVSKESRPDIDLVMQANNIIIRNKQRSSTVVTDEEREQFAEFWEKYENDPLEGRNVILASFCPQVYGLYLVKLAVAMVVAGGVQKVDNNCTRVRGESHLLLVGDPGTGKSQFLKYVCSLVPRCVLTTGIGTTNAGLTVSAVRDEGEWALEAGALVLADGGVCCIDEFNSVREADRAAIHEAMEQQTISVAKAGLVCKLNSRCSILAATNPKGQYDSDESLSVNVALASPLLSRFDLILVLLDTRNPEWDKIVSSYILEGRDPLSGDGGGKDDWSLEQLRAYFCHIRSIQPVITPKANAIMARYYQVQRQSDQRSQARTTIRLLESLVRLSQGHARLMMRTEVTVQDAVMAVTVMEASMCGTSLMTGINPLHTAFPRSAKSEYENQVSIVLEKLRLLDIMHEELGRLNEQATILKNTSFQIKPHKKDTDNEDNIHPSAHNAKYVAPNVFKPFVNEDKMLPRIEELEEKEYRHRKNNQLTLDEMAKQVDQTLDDLEPDVSFSNLMEPSTSKRKGKSIKVKTKQKRKLELMEGDIKEMQRVKQRNKTSKRENADVKRSGEVCPGSSSGMTSSPSQQVRIDKSVNDLFDHLDDFEDDTVNHPNFIKKIKRCSGKSSAVIDDSSDINCKVSQKGETQNVSSVHESRRETKGNVSKLGGNESDDKQKADNFPSSQTNTVQDSSLNVLRKYSQNSVGNSHEDNLICGQIDCEEKAENDRKNICESLSKDQETESVTDVSGKKTDRVSGTAKASTSSKSVSAKLKRFSFILDDDEKFALTETNSHEKREYPGEIPTKLGNANTENISTSTFSSQSHVGDGISTTAVKQTQRLLPKFLSSQGSSGSPSPVRIPFGAVVAFEDMEDEDFELDL